MPKVHRVAVSPFLHAVVIATATAPGVLAQAPSHQHYATTADAQRPAPDGSLAPRLQNLGAHAFPVTIASQRAQLFMNQGLNLAYGFNHAEAGRAFREAARLDPDCAMALWGQALVLGPNINSAMDPKDEAAALELARKAAALKSRATPREQAYIDALAQRYSGDAADRSARDRAYAAAMKQVAQRFPADLDAAVLYAESVMDLRPWGYWMPDGTPYEGTAEIVALLESVMQRDPNHPGALHLYIHLLEPTKDAARAVPAADRLLTLMPAAGHMVHMPGHIYQRVGRYADAVHANELAIRADEDYITQCRAQGLYPMGYYPHNVHFLWWSATMDGRASLAIEAARKVAARIPDAMLKEMPMLAGFRVVPAFALSRFGRWDDVLQEPAPPAGVPFYQGIWHYARGLAFLGKGQPLDAEGELVAVRKALASPDLDVPLFSPNTMRAVLAIAPEVLAGELAAARRDYATAIAHLERAVRLEDGLVYTEPAEWHYPPRHALGAVLLEAGRATEAETVYWEDLRKNPENGWALTGLLQALKAQGRTQDAGLIAARLETAWRRADLRPNASRISATTLVAKPHAPADEASAKPFEKLTLTQSPSGVGSMAPQLAAAADGRLFLSWLEPTAEGVQRFRVAERSSGAWESRADIVRGASLFANWADVPSVFAARDGRVLAHWLEKTGSSMHAYGIRVSESGDGGRNWTPPVTPHRDDSNTEHGFLSFFDAPDGGVGMVWLDGRSTAHAPTNAPPPSPGHGHGGGAGAMTLRSTAIRTGAALQEDVLVDARVCDCCPTAAARTSRGVIAAYRDRSDGEIRDISVARFVDGGWQPGGSVHADGWKIEGCPVNGPALASMGDSVALAWFTAARDEGRVFVAFSRDGGASFGEPVRVDGGGTLGRVDVELLPDGSAVVLWIESGQDRTDLRARRIFADGRRGPAAVIATVGADRSSGHPRVVRSGNELYFAWREPAPASRVAVAVAGVPADAAR
jgi:tetratricopeptide (TPR) repeat protein